MNSLFQPLINRLRDSYTYRNKINFNEYFAHTFKSDLTEQDASDAIERELLSSKPSMIARFGGIELDVLTDYLEVNKPKIIQTLDYIKGDFNNFGWREPVIDKLNLFSKKNEDKYKQVEKFSQLFLQDIKCVDILGSWQENEKRVKKYYPQELITVDLKDLEPYYHPNPWSKTLKDKKVLVVNPFTKSIKEQYEKRELLFEDKNALPQFELKTINTFHTFFGIHQDKFDDWFDVLDFMKSQMDEQDYDIAIIGCGPYGFHLAAHAKRRGKKAIHLGGATQLLFGIIGKRWETTGWKDLFHFKNDHWIRPSKEETPDFVTTNNLDFSAYW